MGVEIESVIGRMCIENETLKMQIEKKNIQIDELCGQLESVNERLSKVMQSRINYVDKCKQHGIAVRDCYKD